MNILYTICLYVCFYNFYFCRCISCCKRTKQQSINKNEILIKPIYDKEKYEKFKNVKINEYISEYGLEEYSKFIIQILENELKWTTDGDVQGGVYTKYAFKNEWHKTRIKYNTDKQILRWLSTTLSNLYLNSANSDTLTEVQCYLHENKIYIATNNDSDANKIEKNILSKKLINDIVEFCNKNSDIKNNDEGIEHDVDKRKIRHIFKLNKALQSNYYTNSTITSISNNNFFVIKSEHLNNIAKGIHCERKIFEYLKLNKRLIKLDINKLGGIRRPCLMCWVYLFNYETENNCGILWGSQESFINTIEDMTINDIIERIKKVEHTNSPFIVDDQSDDEKI